MDAASLIIAIPGLLNDCLELLERVNSTREFENESRHAIALWDASKMGLRAWAEDVGLDNESSEKVRHPRLEDAEIMAVVKKNLQSIQDICKSLDVTRSRWSMDVGNEPTAGHTGLRRQSSRSNFRNKVSWGFKTGSRFKDQVKSLQDHVDRIYQLVPPGPRSRISGNHQHVSTDGIPTSLPFPESHDHLSPRVLAQERRQMEEWLDVLRIDQQYDRLLSSRLDGTCDWIFNHSKYKKWDSPHSAQDSAQILWICGPAGYGKSTLCARLIQVIKAASKSSLAYAFCSAHVQAGSRPESIVRTWMFQLVKQDSGAHRIVWESLQRPEAESVASRSDIWKLLGALMSNLNNCTLIMDGLDEFDGSNDARKEFLRDLRTTITQTNARVLIASRDEIDIRSELSAEQSENGPEILECMVSEADVQEDIASFSAAVVNEMLPSKKEEVRLGLADQMARKSEGMFLWIKMQKNQLKDTKNHKQLQKLINDMPSGLPSTYERNRRDIQKLSPEEQNRAEAILRWVAFSFRPLTVLELTEALLLNADVESNTLCQDDMPDEINDAYINGEIKRLCGSLIEIKEANPHDSPGSRTVHLVHSSVKDYLLSDPHLNGHGGGVLFALSNISKQHAVLSKACIQYLNYQEVWSQESSRTDELSQHPFLEYAASMWYLHLGATKNSFPDILDLVNQFMLPNNPNFVAWSEHFEASQNLDFRDQVNKVTSSPLYYAALFNLLPTMEYYYAKSKSYLNFSGGRYATPLQAACAKGHLEAFERLLEWGADVNAAGGEFGSALNAATALGNEVMVKRLLSLSASFSVLDHSKRNAIVIASLNGHHRLLSLFAEKGESIASAQFGYSPLIAAASNNQKRVMDLLLDYGADINATDNFGEQALHCSAHYGHIEIAGDLLERGANLFSRNHYGESPLHVSAAVGKLQMAKLLLERGASESLLTISSSGRIPLVEAVVNGHHDMVELLLYKGGNHQLSISDDKGYTPLNTAASCGQAIAVEILLDHGADPTSVTRSCRTTLNNATLSGHLSVVQILLERGPDALASLSDTDGWSPIHAAAQFGHVEIAELLLRHGADHTARNNEGVTPFHSTAFQGNVELACLFLARGAEINAQDDNGFTALHIAAERGLTEYVSFLLSRNADAELPCRNGRTPICSACFNGYVGVIRLLFERGLSFGAMDNNGWYPLFLAAQNGHLEVVRLLLDAVAEPRNDSTFANKALEPIDALQKQQREKKYALKYGMKIQLSIPEEWFPLCIAAANGHLDVIQVLVDRQIGLEAVRERMATTALYCAATHGQLNAVQYLLSHGADVNVRHGFEGWTPLLVAIENDNLALTESLLHLGADPTIPLIRESKHQTPLYRATWNSNDQMVELLLRESTKVDTVTLMGSDYMPVNLAAFNGNVKILKLFLEQRMDLKILRADQDGRTALHLAARNAFLEGVDLLLDTGFDATARDHRGQNVLDYAAASGSLRMVEKILGLPCALELAKATSDWTPLHWAARNGEVRIVEKLIAVGVEETVVKTSHPERSWTPWAVAWAAGNRKLILNTRCPLRLRDEEDVQEPLGTHTGILCDACESPIIGTRFSCRTCFDFDYCFMCIVGGRDLHPGHEWDITEARVVSAVETGL